MRHHDKNRTLGGDSNWRKHLLKDLAVAFIDHEKITTTEARAKELRPFVEKLVTKGKAGNVASLRLLEARLGSKSSAKKLVDVISKRYKERMGGYTRIIKLAPVDGNRKAIIEFV